MDAAPISRVQMRYGVIAHVRVATPTPQWRHENDNRT